MEILAAGTIVDDRYEILSHIGGGGMGEIFRAKELELGRVIALKVLHSTTSDADSLARFEREGKVLSSLSHSNILTVFRFGVWRGVMPYIAMEYLEGTSLRGVLDKDGRMEAARGLALMLQVTEAMEYAHEHGVVHRDLTPNNIMLVDQPEPDTVKIIDFGLAKVFAQSGAESQHLTQTGLLIGSVFYMSPEQCLGRKSDARSDIYSLACVLYECLAGVPPLTAENPIGLMHKHVNLEPVPLTAHLKASQIPGGLQQVLNKAMSKQIDNRYQSMKEFGADLRFVSQGRPQEVRAEAINNSSGPAKSILVVASLAVVFVAAASVFLLIAMHKIGARVPEATARKTIPLGLKGQVQALLFMKPGPDRLEAARQVEERIRAEPSIASVDQIRCVYNILMREFTTNHMDIGAISYSKRAIEFLKSESPNANTRSRLEALGDFYSAKATCELRLLRLEEARKDYQKSFDHWKQVTAEPTVLGVCLAGVAEAELGLEQYCRAETDARRAIAYFQKASKIGLELPAQVTLETSLLRQGRREEEASEYKSLLSRMGSALPSEIYNYYAGLRAGLIPIGDAQLCYDRLGDGVKLLAQRSGCKKEERLIDLLQIEELPVLGLYDQAIPRLRKLEKESTDKDFNLRVFANIGAVYRDLGDNQAAVEAYERALALTGEDNFETRISVNSGLFTVAHRMRDAALVQRCLSALDRDLLKHVPGPDRDLSLRLPVADVLISVGSHEQAEKFLASGLGRYADSKISLMQNLANARMGRIRFQQGRLEEAAKIFKDVLANYDRLLDRPGRRDPTIFIVSGQCARRLNQIDDFSKVMDEVLSKAKASGDVRRWFFRLLDAAIFADAANDWALAEKYMEQAIAIRAPNLTNSDYRDAELNYASVESKLHKESKAIAILTKLEKQIQGQPSEQFGEGSQLHWTEKLLSGAYRSRGDYKKARQHSELAVKVCAGQNVVLPLVELIDVCFDLQDFKSVEKYLKLARTKLNRNYDANIAISVELRQAELFFHTSRLNEASTLIHKLLDQPNAAGHSELVWVLNVAAKCDQAQGKNDEAIQHLKAEIVKLKQTYSGDCPLVNDVQTRLAALETK